MKKRSAIPIEHLQSRLLRLMDSVRTQRSEPETLRAEVLLAMNQMCSAELLLGLWQTLEEVGARGELLLVQLLCDLETERFDTACSELLESRDPGERAIGYGVVALRARPRGAVIVADAFEREPGIVLRKGGRRHLAPHSFVTCMLAGIREFKDPVLDRLAVEALRQFAAGKSDLDLIAKLLEDKKPSIAELGFVSLASRFMGKLHRLAYMKVMRGREPNLTNAERAWMFRAMRLIPEIVEAIAEPGPLGVGDADFIRGRIAVLRALRTKDLTEFVRHLLQTPPELQSVRIERARSKKQGPSEEENRLACRSIAFLLSLLIGHRYGLSLFVTGLAEKGDLEMDVIYRILTLSGPNGALNLSAAMVAHWYELNPDDAEEGPFWRWIDGLWQDDRLTLASDGVTAALAHPNETAIYATRVLGTLGDGFAALSSSFHSGQPIDVGDLAVHLNNPLLVPVLRACLHDPEAELHPVSLVTLGRTRLTGVMQSLRMRLSSCLDRSLVEAGARAIRLVDAEAIVENHPIYRDLLALNLRPADREIESHTNAEGEEEVDEDAVGLVVLRVYFWLADSVLPIPVGTRPASGYAARAEFVVDVGTRTVLHGTWTDRDGHEHSEVSCPPPPHEFQAQFYGIPWRTPLAGLEKRVQQVGGELLATVPLSDGSTRTLATIGDVAIRLDTHAQGGFFRAVVPVDFTRLESATNAAMARFGRPTFRTGSSAVWRFEGMEVGIRPDPAFDTLSEYVALLDDWPEPT